MEYSEYTESRDFTWEELIENRICELPIKITTICKSKGIPVLSYAQGAQVLRDCGLFWKCETTDGFTVLYKGQHYIFYNQACSDQRCRFTIAHELGHIVHKHPMTVAGDYQFTVINREPTSKDSPLETQANVFASRILAPSCVLWGLKVTTANEIAELCDISMQSAVFRMSRLQKLYNREQRWLKEKGRSCFLLSPLEQDVFSQFEPYIKEHTL